MSEELEFGTGTAGCSAIMKKAVERLEDVIKANDRLDRRWRYDTEQHFKKKAQGGIVPAEPPKREFPKLTPVTMMAVRVAKDYMALRVRLQELLTSDKAALEAYRRIDTEEQMADAIDGKFYDTIKEVLLRSVVLPPEIHTNGERMVAFTCPACDGHTILAYGTTFYHCPKCGQRLKDYDTDGMYGAICGEDIDEIMGKVERKVKADAALYEGVKDNWTIGEEYELMLELPEKDTAGGVKFARRRKVCRLLAKYPRYALFEYDGRGGTRLKVTQMWQDIRLAR